MLSPEIHAERRAQLARRAERGDRRRRDRRRGRAPPAREQRRRQRVDVLLGGRVLRRRGQEAVAQAAEAREEVGEEGRGAVVVLEVRERKQRLQAEFDCTRVVGVVRISYGDGVILER